MMQEGTQYIHSRRRVLFTNALSEKMLGQNPEKDLSARNGAFPACRTEPHARARAPQTRPLFQLR